MISPDILPSSIPKLNPHGENWAIFQIRFQNMMEVKDKWEHFDGSSTRPADEDEAIEWDKEERMAKYLLTQCLPDSTVVWIQRFKTVHEQWVSIVKEYTEKGESVQTEMHHEFMEMKCGAGVDVQQFLSDLRTRCEEMIACGVSIDDNDYQVTIVCSIPKEIADFASSTLSAARLIDHTKKIDPDQLILLILEEYDRCHARVPKNVLNQRPDRRGGDSVAMAAAPATRGGRTRRGACWNCGERGHHQNECPKERGSTNVVELYLEECDGAWAAAELSDSEDDFF